MNGLWQDVRFAARGLRRDPWFAMFIVIALTLGIGANAAMFGIADRLILSGPQHIRDSARVVRMYLTASPDGRRQFTTSSFGHVSYELARRASAFDEVATYAVNDILVGDGATAKIAHGGYASAGLFPLLGVAPALGRFFGAAEDRPGSAEHVAVLGDAAWQRWFGGRHDVIGQDVTIGSHHYAIVGVAPRGFTGPQLGPVDVWLPMSLRGPQTTAEWQTSWNAQWLRIVGRLKPTVTFARANDELTTIHRANYAGTRKPVAQARMTVAPLSANDDGVEAPEVFVVRWLSGVALMVLTIACANVTNLLIARGMRRSREIALRTALGARAWRLVRLLLVESLLLACGGALGGIAVASLLSTLAHRFIFSAIEWGPFPIDGRVLAASIIIALMSGLIVGLLPAWRAVRTTLAAALKTGVREGRGQRSTFRHALTITQAALSVVLLVGAGLFVRSLWNVRALHLGVDPDRVLVADVSRASLSLIADSAAKEAERTRRRDFTSRAIEQLRRVPGVEHTSAAVGLPFGNRFTPGTRVPGLTTLPQMASGPPGVSAVTSDYFATVGTRIVRGRAFGPDDHAGTEPIAIVSSTMAAMIWPDQEAIGKCLISGADPAPCARIVGIAEDTHRSELREPPVMHYYIPFGQEVGFGGTEILARTAGSTAAATVGPEVRRALVALDSTIRYVGLSTIQEAIDPQTASWRIGATVFSLAGVLALIVAAIGMYSVMSYLVADRTHEIGVRLALGARGADLARMLLGGSALTAGTGVAIGSLGALAVGRFVEPLLFDESARDPAIFAAVGAMVVIVALAAAAVPTWRARNIDPLEALRVE